MTRRPSIANDVRREQREEELAMTPAERVRIALSLFERGIAAFTGGQEVTREEALRLIDASRQKGRRRSRCMQG